LIRSKLIIALVMCAAAAPLPAQQWHVEAQGGRMRSALDPANTVSQSLVAGIRYERFNSGLRFSAGIPTRADEPLWGSVSGAHRFALQRGLLVAGVDVSANAFVLHDRVQRTQQVGGGPFQPPTLVPAPSLSGFATSLQGMPLIGIETGTVQAHVRAGISRYASAFGEAKRTRSVPLADAQISWLPTPALVIAPSVRHYKAEEDDYTFAGITTVASQGPLTAWASSGRWLKFTEQDATWAAGASLRIHKRATVSASGRHDAFDPLYLTPAQTAWSIGISVQVGGPAGQFVAPAVQEGGRATIRLPAKHAPSAPLVAGDFTNWQPRPMQRSGDTWVFSVTLNPGVYNYAFVDAAGAWFVPEEHPGRKQDGMGGVVAVLVVK
jgi:hypothetical protein